MFSFLGVMPSPLPFAPLPLQRVVPFRYTYLGDKHTRADLRGAQCDPVRREDGKCVVSTKMATALVRFEDGTLGVVARRRLRLNTKLNG